MCKLTKNRHCGAVEREAEVDDVGQIGRQCQQIGDKIHPSRGALPSAPLHKAKRQQVHQQHRRIQIDQGREIKAQSTGKGWPQRSFAQMQQVRVENKEDHARKREGGQRKQQSPEQQAVDRSGKLGETNHEIRRESAAHALYINKEWWPVQIKCEVTREHEANCATNIPSATRQCGRGDIIDKESVEPVAQLSLAHAPLCLCR